MAVHDGATGARTQAAVLMTSFANGTRSSAQIEIRVRENGDGAAIAEQRTDEAMEEG